MENKKAFIIIFLTVFIDLLGFGLIVPILPNYAKSLGAADWQFGLIASVFSLLNFIFTPFLGAYSDRVGRRPVILISVFMNMIGYIIFAYANALPLFIFSRVINGIGSSNISAAQAYIADISSPENRTKMMGMIGAAFGLGFIFGPLFGGLIAAAYGDKGATDPALLFGIRELGFAAAALCLINLVSAYFLLPESNKNLNANSPIKFVPINDYKKAFTQPVLRELMWFWAIYVLAFAAMQTVSALLWKEKYGFDEKHIGYLFGIIGIASVIVQGGLVGRLNKAFGEKKLLVMGCILMMIGLATVPFVPTEGFWFWAVINICFISLGNGCLTPSITALVSKITPPEEQGRMLGLSQSVGSVSRILGPAMSGVFYGWNYALPYLVGGGLMIVGLYLASLIISAVNKQNLNASV
jgi:MFS transporter, DHA1 family, tetracycline resistance protein